MICFFYLLIPLGQFLPIAGDFSPAFLIFLPDRDIEISALDISLQLLDQCVWKDRLCVQIFNAWFLFCVLMHTPITSFCLMR